MPRITKEQRIAEAFARIERAALAGERCPTSGDGLVSGDVTALAHAGKIAVEISTHNFRRITILEGEHKGKSTAANPLKTSTVYMTIDKRGTLRNGWPVDHGGYKSSKNKRTQPSAPTLAPYALKAR